MHRSSLLAAGTAATALLVAPACAFASGSVTAGPMKVKGYSLTISATDGGASDSLSVSAVKQSGTSMQIHTWSFSGAKVSVKGANATIKGKFGRYGSINAKIHTAGRAVKGYVPAGCKGKPGSARKGLMTGKTAFVLDSTYFKTLKPKKLKAQIAKAGKLDCSSAGGGGETGSGAGTLMLMSSITGADGQLTYSVTKVGSIVQQSVMRSDAGTAPATISHMITARTGASGLTAASDLSSASAPAAGPFLTGTFGFAGEPMGTMATGNASGGFTALFDSIGKQTLPEGADAMLMKR